VSGRGANPLPAIVVRGIAGLSILLMIFAPVTVALAVWQWDWRWLVTGVVSLAVGFFIGWGLVEGGKKASGS